MTVLNKLKKKKINREGEREDKKVHAKLISKIYWSMKDLWINPIFII